MQAWRERQRGEKLFHGDATRWNGLANMAGQGGHRWSLWVTRSASGVFCPIAPSRGAAVPHEPLAKLPTDGLQAVRVWARSRASKALAQDQAEIVWASGWAHVRRDVRKAARRWPALAPWRWPGREDIRPLSRLHTARLAVWEAPRPFAHPTPACVARPHALTTHLGERQRRWEMSRHARHRDQAPRPRLERLHQHWGGRTVFLTRPEGALDNNRAARAVRPPGVGRKN